MKLEAMKLVVCWKGSTVTAGSESGLLEIKGALKPMYFVYGLFDRSSESGLPEIRVQL